MYLSHGVAEWEKYFALFLSEPLLLNQGATQIGLVGSQDCATVVSSQTQFTQACSGAQKPSGNETFREFHLGFHFSSGIFCRHKPPLRQHENAQMTGRSHPLKIKLSQNQHL